MRYTRPIPAGVPRWEVFTPELIAYRRLAGHPAAVVDADLAKESARLQALQVQQQLGAQALSIANSAPQIILSLFRGG